MTALLALDQGTSSTRSIVFSIDGQILAIEQEALQQHYPHNGWVEHDAEEIWQAQLRTAERAIARAGQPIAAIGITNQRETVVLWDRKTARPLHRAIVWQDRRTAGRCRQLKEHGHEKLVQQKTGLVLDPYFSAGKIAWLLDKADGAREAAVAGTLACGTIDSWLLYRLSAGQCHFTDVSNAGRTSLMNIDTAQWDDELLDIFGVPGALLPEIKSSSEIYCTTELFGDAIPVSGIAGDQQAALFGQRCREPGQTKCTYGTGAFIMRQCGAQRSDVDGLLSTPAWQLAGQPMQYALEGSVFSAGSAVQWLRDGLGIIHEAADVESLAASVDHHDDIFFIPAFTGLGTPYWDPTARGCIIGITRDTSKGHIARACLESIAHQVADVIDAMRTAGDCSLLRVDGGAAANHLLLQTQANLAQLQVDRPQQVETTALGAAWLAALGAGICSENDLHWQHDLSLRPLFSAEHALQLRQRWDQAVQRSLHWANDDS